MQAVVAGSSGMSFVADLNDPTNGGANPAPNYLNIGVGSNQDWVTPPWNTPGSVRSSSSTAFYTGSSTLNPNGFPVGGNKKLRIVSNATVSRVLFDRHNNAIGVEYVLNAIQIKVFNVYASKKVILAAGTISDAVFYSDQELAIQPYLIVLIFR